MKPFAPVGKFLLVFLALGATAAVAATPNVRSSRATIPPGLLAAMARSEAAAAAHAPGYRLDARGCTRLPAPAPGACFGAHGARIDGGAHPLALTLTGWGSAGAIRRVHLVRAAPRANRIEYRGRHITESWQALPLGFEQTFVLTQPPAGFAQAGGRIVLQLRANRAPRRIGTRLAWGRLRYGGLAVRDAAGHAIPAVLSAHGRIITLSIRAAHARWPITVDPLVWLQQEVTASDGAAGDQFGQSVALSGTTALIGADEKTINGNASQGAVYVYTESNSTWSQQAELLASDGAANDFFGLSVALSSSGTTVLVGAVGKTVGTNGDQGATYVFAKSGSTWSQQAELLATNGAVGDQFGFSVALSGTTAVIGAVDKTVNGNTYQGAAYVFTKSNGTWSQQAELVAANGAANDVFGGSVALTGTTAVISASGKTVGSNVYQGAAYVFTAPTPPSTAWNQATELTATDGTAGDSFGYSVALSGTTVVIGALNKTVNGNAKQGAAYVYTESGGTWSQQAELTAANGGVNDIFGLSVALSGTTAVIGAPYKGQGAAYVFTGSGANWSQQTELTAADGAFVDDFGYSIALSSSGTTALISANNKTINGNAYQGAAYFFSPSNLANVLNAPASVLPNAQFTSQYILTNSDATASAAVAAWLPVPAGATYVSATASQGSCSYDSTTLAATCLLGAIAGNGGTASASLTLKTTAPAGTTLAESAEVSNATPPLSATAAIPVTLPPSPTISGLTNLTVAAGQSGTESFTLTGTGVLTLTATSSNTTLLPNAGITGASSCTAAGSCTLSLIPAAGQSGTATVTVTVADTYGQSATGTFSFTVNAPPTVSGLTNLTVAAGKSGTESFTFAGTGTLTVTATSSNATLLPNANITGAGICTAAGSCILSLAPAAGRSGTATVTVTVADTYGQSATGTFTFTVNKPPPSGGGGGGGGGALGLLGLLALLGLAVPVTLRRRRTRG